MSSEDVRIVRELFEATNRRDFPAVMARYAPDIELLVGPGFPTAGTYRGSDAVGRFFADWLRTFDAGFHFELTEVVEGPDAIAVVARHRATGTRSGITLDAEMFYAYWVRDGLVLRVEMPDTREEAMRAAGLLP